MSNEINEETDESVNQPRAETMDDLRNRLIHEIDTIQTVNQLSGKPNKQINENDLTRAVIKACDIIFIDYSSENDMSEYTYAIYNPRTMSYVRDDQFLSELIQSIINSLTMSPSITTKRAANIVDSAIMANRDNSQIRIANLPPKHIIKFKNKILNLQTKEIYNHNDEEVEDYDFIETLRYRYLKIEETNQDMLENVKKVFNLWSQEDDDVKLLIMQLFFAYIEGNGRNKYIILQSEGGDGKSTAMRMIQKMGHSKLTNYINLNDLSDDNVINQIQPSTRFLFGDDLMSNFKMGNKELARFKTLVDGGFINVNVKYMPNKLVNCEGLKIQATNTDIKFYENNSAVKDRIIYIKWPHYNFRQNPIEDFNLDQLSGKNGKANTDFMEALIAYIINEVEYFNQFSVTEKMQEDFNEMLEENDIVQMQINELEENGLLNFEVIPNIVLYEHYKQWLNENNPSSKPMKSMDYSKKANKILESMNYTKSTTTKRIRSWDKEQFDIDQFENLYIDDSKKSRFLINNNLNIDISDLINDYNNLQFNDVVNKYTNNQIQSLIQKMKINQSSDALNLANYLNIKTNEFDILQKREILYGLKKILVNNET